MTFVDQLLQFILSGITQGSIYAIVALGFTIIYNSTEIINFAQGEFVMLGAMFMLTLNITLGLPLPVAFILSVIAVMIIGVLIDIIVISPIKKPTQLSLIIITIGASIFVKGVAMFVWKKDYHAATPFSGEVPISIGPAAITPQALWVIGITGTVLIFLHIFFEYTNTGKGMRACAINPRAASLLGIKVKRMVLISFGLAGALGAIAGIIIAPITFANYNMGLMLGLKGFCGAVIGGLGSVPGAIVGGFALGILESLGAGLISSAYKDAIAFVVLLLVLFMKPTGILGKSESKRV